MIDFLSQAVVYRQLIMVWYAQLLGHDLGGFETQAKSLRWCVLKVGIFLFGDNQQVDRGFGAMVGDHEHLVGFVEDFGGRFAPDHAGEDAGHGGKYTTWELPDNSRLHRLQTLANPTPIC